MVDGHVVLRLARRPSLRGSLGHGRHPLGVPDRRPHQREPVGLRRPGVRDDLRGLVRLPRPQNRRGAVDDVPETRRLPLRELLREPVVRRRAPLLGRARGHGLRARRVERARRLDGRRRRPRLHDARRRGRTRLRRRVRRHACARSAPTSGDELWSTEVGGRILGAPVVIGPYVFFSTLEKRTYALRVSDGSIAWRLPLGKYTPGIATERTYFFSLNGRLIATPRSRRSERTSG